MYSATRSIYLEDPGVERQHRIILDSHSIFPIFWSHLLFPRFRASPWPGSIISSHPHPTLLEPGWLLIIAWTDREGWHNFVFLGDGRGDGTNHHEKIEWTQRCTPRPWSSESRDVLGCHDWASLQTDLEAVINRVWRCTSRPWPSINLEVVEWEAGAMGAETLFIGLLVIVGM